MAKASQYLKLIDSTGETVPGESIDEEHLNEIDLVSWGWSVEDPAAIPKDESAAKGDKSTPKGSPSSSNGESDGKIQPSLLSISKRTDRSTHRLISSMDRGEVFPKAVLVIKEEFKESISPFNLEVTLTNAFVVKGSLSVDAGDKSVEFKEDWEFNYSNIKFAYTLRGAGNRGVVNMDFERPRDSSATSAKKPELSTGEKQAAKDTENAEWAKRNGWKPPGK